MEKKPFPLVNIAKYSKNHYQYTGNIWYDLALCLQADDYGPYFGHSHKPGITPQEECFNHRKIIAELIVSKLQPYIPQHRQTDLLGDISPQDCWRVGYYTNLYPYSPTVQKISPEYEYWQAVVRAHLSIIALTSYEELGYDNWDKLEECNIPELQKTTEQKQ